MIDSYGTSSPIEMRRFTMEETDYIAIINDLKQNLNDTLVYNNFNLLHPQVLYLSLKINSLLVPIFRKQLPKAKIIQFPVK